MDVLNHDLETVERMSETSDSQPRLDLPIEAAGFWNLHLTAEALKQIFVHNAI